MSEHTHKLRRITLVNWYLFSAEDIEINGNSTLFRGQNGVGKSSILDALQTCFSGADENLMSMNAASSNGKRSGRTVRSYALGEVAESPGHAASEPRSVSNSYVALTFEKPNGECYAFGISLFVKGSSSEVVKNHFLLDGNDIKADDFILEDDQIVTWKVFEHRLMSGRGRYIPVNSAKHYRDEVSILMSPADQTRQISSAPVFRAIKNGLTFKERDSMTDFCRDFILPEQNIDVLRIENDYKEFSEIIALIENAKERLATLNGVNKLLSAYESNMKKGLAYRWAEQEASVICFDAQREALEDQVDSLEIDLKALGEKSARLEEIIPELDQKTLDAHSAFKNSNHGVAIEQCKANIDRVQAEQRKAADEIRGLRGLLAGLISITPPIGLSEISKYQYKKAIDAMSSATGSVAGIENNLWPQSEQEVEEAIIALALFAPLVSQLKGQLAEIAQRLFPIKNELDQKQSALEKLQQGKSSLSNATIDLIEALMEEGIESKPVCDLAEVTDTSWQNGIERFLGGNREALVVIGNDGGEASPDLIERAISIYRTEKKEKKHIRKAKLINPERIHDASSHEVAGYAAGLIRANHPTAQCYLESQLKNVELVSTEAELRESSRAITKDGMVAANGTISGGNRIDFVLLGKQARLDYATQLETEIKPLKDECDQLEKQETSMSMAYSHLLQKVSEVKPKLEGLIDIFRGYHLSTEKLESLNCELEGLESSPDSQLKENYDQLSEKLKSTRKEYHQTGIDHANKTSQLSFTSQELKQANEAGDKAVSQRNELERREGFRADLAADTLESLQERFGEDTYDKIRDESKKLGSKSYEDANSKLNRARAKAIEYATNNNVADRQELGELTGLELKDRCQEHADRIENTEIQKYQFNAETAHQNLMDGFRSEVIAKLKENFHKVDATFRDLNNALKDIAFNGNSYGFIYPVVEDKLLKTIYDYTVQTTDIEAESSDGLFATPNDDPAIKIIDDALRQGQLAEIADYRMYYNYDLISTNINTGTKRGFQELVSVGSGGEKGTPYYVALGAAFMTAYKVRINGAKAFGGAALAIFDEAFSKIDGSNSKAALQFFSDIGLQVVLAAPPESESKVGPYVDNSYNVVRSGDAMYLYDKKYKDAGKELFQSDDPFTHPELVDQKVKELGAIPE